jgi:four helix bundle protein
MTFTYKKFHETELWKEAFLLQKEVFQLTQQYPRNELYGLSSQSDDASNAVCANIAEAHGRYYFGDKVRVLYIARGEIEEMQSHLFVATSRGYINKEISVSLVNKYEDLKKQLNNAVRDYWQKKKNA